MTTLAPGADRPLPPPPPRSLGIDAEQIARFDKLAGGDKPWRHVYSPREAEHLAAGPRAAQAFCFAFCCKEAFCKALGEPYNFPQLECLYRPDAAEQQIVLAPALRERHSLARVRVLFDGRHLEERGEALVEVHLRRGSAAPADGSISTLRAGAGDAPRAGVCLESLAVAAVEAGRSRIESEYFRAEEIADLGSRRVQSLAGFLALKRALAGLWAESGTMGVHLRDFSLGHHPGGAPRLVGAPAGVAPERALISISHTRQWAYALAALAPPLED